MLGRGQYGVEWVPRPKDRESSALVRVVAVVAVLAAVSLTWTLVSRMRMRPDEPAPPEAVETVPAPVERVPDAVELGPSAPAVRTAPAEIAKRPVGLRNLLMRLEEAERRRDTEMAISAIEQIRAYPGSPAADLDNALARRLGTLNMRRLFVQKNAQWVATVTVKSGSSASRIAAEHGSTFASMQKLNGVDLDKVRTGQKVHVLDHPRFNLAVHRRTRTADLFLNGKFFKRYDLLDETGTDGSHEVTPPFEKFWRTVRIRLKAADRRELELLLPKGASVLISEI